MLKKIIKVIKDILKNWLNKIEQAEQKINLQNRLKSAKKKELLIFPEWVLVVLVILVFIIGIFIKNFILQKKFNLNSFIFVLLSSFILIYFIVKFIFGSFVSKIKNLLNLKNEEYKNSFVLLLTLTLLHICLILLFELYNINIYLIPTVGLVMLVSMLLNIWWAVSFIFLNIFTGSFLYIGSLTDILPYILYFVLSSLYVLTLVDKIYSRQDIFTTISKTVLVNFFISVITYILVIGEVEDILYFKININPFVKNNVNIVYFLYTNLVSGVINWLLVTILLSPLEVIYHRTTNIKLIELTNFNHPLLKKLMTEAPGTYHHSLMVASLAEGVASKLGINSFLCKVGGYFHDIGKILQPEYFIENQFSIQNPHSEINQSLSALVIINHVKEGVKLAKEYKIDKQVIDIIEQHHGNSLIHGLYNNTLEFGFLNKDMVRYPGPKPQTKETAVVMICDSCEAACRSLQEFDLQKIKETVEQVINSKFVDGQFDEVPLTLRDLYVISNVVTQMLISFYHVRTHNIEEKKQDGN